VLLEHSLGDPRSDDDERVAQLMDGIRANSADELSTADVRQQSVTGRFAFKGRRWILLPATTAAVLVALLFLMPVISEKRAHAAVTRSLVAEQSPLVRHYAVSVMTESTEEAASQHDFQLFIKQKSFVVQMKSLIGNGSHWLGGDDHERWVVPRAGPVLIGADGLLGRWFRNRRKIRTPFLRTSTILKRLQSAYDLQMRSSVKLTSRQADESEVICDYVVGTRQQSASLPHIPDRINLWANKRTGFAHRVELQWDDPKSAIGITSVAIELVDTPEVSDDFFEHFGHHDTQRRIIRRPVDSDLLSE